MNPVVEGFISVVPNQRYEVFIEIVLTDVDHSIEYADISVDDVNFGRCNPDQNIDCNAWYDCTRTSHGTNVPRREITSISGRVKIIAKYNTHVHRSGCKWNGKDLSGIVRVTMTPI